MIKYRVELSRWRVATKIEPVEVTKETAKSVFILTRFTPWGTGIERTREDRCDKQSEYQCFFDTWDEAHDFLTAEAQRKVDTARRTLEEAKGYQGNIKDMKKPV